MDTRLWSPIAAAVLALGLLSSPGCSSTHAEPGGFQPATAASLAPLGELELRLTRLVVGGEELALPVERPLTSRLAPGKIAGRSAVNQYSGGFELGDDGALRWSGGFLMTRMAGPPEAMELEDRFLAALTASTRLLTAPEGARFQSADATTVLEFAR